MFLCFPQHVNVFRSYAYHSLQRSFSWIRFRFCFCFTYMVILWCVQWVKTRAVFARRVICFGKDKSQALVMVVSACHTCVRSCKKVWVGINSATAETASLHALASFLASYNSLWSSYTSPRAMVASHCASPISPLSATLISSSRVSSRLSWLS